jgi:hypothetical protein
MNTTSSTQPTLGEWLKEQGIAQCWDNTKDAWKALFFETADILALEKGSVTAEEVIASIGYPEGSPNAIGAAMHKWAKARNAVPTYEKSLRASRHSAIISRWHVK